MDAESAQRYGLANRVVPDDELVATAQRWARRLADGPSFALAVAKKLVSRELDMDLHSALELEAFTQAFLVRSEDHAEFFRGREDGCEARWTGR